MDFDLSKVILYGICLLIGIFYILIKHRKWIHKSEYTRPLLIGTLLILLSVIGNSLIENKWSVDYIIDFLLLKKVGIKKSFRTYIAIGYTLVIWGAIIFLIIKFRKVKNKTEPEL